MSGGGSNETTTQQSRKPWRPQRKYLKEGFKGAEGVYNTPLEYFPDSTVVPFSSETELGLLGTTKRAQEGSELVGAGGSLLGDTLGGTYLREGNPAYAGMVERSVRPLRDEYTRALTRVDSNFSEAGRGGSNIARGAVYGDVTDAYLRNVGDISSGLSYQNYGDERSRQMGALPQALRYGEEPYRDAAALGDVGAQRERLSGANLDDQIARYNFDQSEPGNRVAQFIRSLQGNYGGTSTTSTRQSGSPGPFDWAGLGADILGPATGVGK